MSALYDTTCQLLLAGPGSQVNLMDGLNLIYTAVDTAHCLVLYRQFATITADEIADAANAIAAHTGLPLVGLTSSADAWQTFHRVRLEWETPTP